jgi:hypothetical protein
MDNTDTGSIEEACVVERKDDVVMARIGERELALMSVEQGAYYDLNEVASRIWELLEAPRSVQDICAALGEEYDVTAHACLRDVTTCLAAWQEQGLVQLHNN